LKPSLIAALALAAGLGLSCRSLPQLPPANLAAPGWQALQGQAIWTPGKGKPELTGELLLATNANRHFFIQFAKIPFTLASAQVADDRWQIEFGSGDYRRSGLGPPPDRFVWFQLPGALAGSGVSGHWKFEHLATNVWRLENRSTGESLEGSFFP
jgi:hypothetical protein